MEKLVSSASEAASALSTRPSTVLKMLESGELPGYRSGREWRVPIKALEKYVMDRAYREAAERRKANEEI